MAKVVAKVKPEKMALLGWIRIKGVQRRIPHDLFTEKQLDDIYKKFPESRNYWTHGNTLKTYHLILDLKIYQGLKEQELEKLETSHLQLDKGKIYVPSTKRISKRILDLKPFQKLPLHEYLLTERLSLNEDIEGNFLFHKKRLIRGMSRIKAMINRSRLKCGTSYEPKLQSIAQINFKSSQLLKLGPSSKKKGISQTFFGQEINIYIYLGQYHPKY